MTAHHWTAVLPSGRAEQLDARVRDSADEIVQARRRGIAQMGRLLAALGDEQG